MKKIYLDGKWILNNERIGTVDATVPGCVHTDLIANGIIKDIFYRDNNKNYQWIENEEWDYECTFDARTDADARLVFEGLDTYAEVYLNGEKLGETMDMFIPYSFDVSSALKSKGNHLRVHFRSPIKEVEGLPTLDGAFTKERMHTRRMQCTYSWDWVDRFVTSGIFRSVYLEYANGIDIDGVYVYTENIDDFSAGICAEIDFKNFDEPGIAHIEVIDPNGKIAEYSDVYVDREKIVRHFDIVDPMLWYPNGYGDHPLYTLKISVGENEYTESFGIRTLKIMQIRDPEGSEYYKKAEAAETTFAGQKYFEGVDRAGFQIVVNGVKIFCKGGNWVPCEPFPSDEGDEKITRLVEMAREMGANFLRVWGGGLFEKKAFYDACDRNGILVAQDFLMACGVYPEKEEWFIDLLAKEAEYATKYLRNHPCLGWYHGDNENAKRGSDTKSDYMGRSSALNGAFPQVFKYDHTRQLLASSPYGGNTYAGITRGTSHTTNFLGAIFDYFIYEDCSDYKEFMEQFVSRFISEEGVFGAISRSSLLKFMTENDIFNDESEEILRYHTRTNPDMKEHIFDCVRAFANKALGGFDDAEDKLFKYQYIQYEWVRVSFENVRRNLGYCNGLIFWMYNDCWPAALGWSFVDYYMMPKHSYYSFIRGSKRVTGSVVPSADAYKLVVSADAEIFEDVRIKAYLLKNGALDKTYEGNVKTSGYGVVELDIPFEYDADAIVVCDLEYNGGKDRCFYKNGILDLHRRNDLLDVSYENDGTMTLKAKGYIHAVALEGECALEDNCFQMLCGETRRVAGENITVNAYSFLDK